MFKKTELKNGLRIIEVPQKNSQATTVLVLVGTGSKYEKKEVSGISHFLEHMYFKGTKKRPTPTAVAESLDKVGGIYNAFTSEDYTGYFAKVASSHFNLALDWVSDIFLNSLLPSKEVKKEKGVITEEINMYYDHPMSYIGILWSRLLYGDQPAGWDIAGTKKSVLSITRNDLMEYMRNQYVSSNTIVCVAGKFDQPSLLPKIKKHFSGIKKGSPLKKPEVIDARVPFSSRQKKPSCLLQERKTDQTHFHLGVRGYNLFHEKRYVQELIAVILGGMMSSRLFVEIRERLGAAYYVSANASSSPETGFLVVQAGTDNKKTEKAVLTTLKEFKKMALKKVPKEELEKAKECIKGKMALRLETSDAKASFFGLQELLKKEILTEKEIYKEIDQISQSDILKVASEIFREENLNLAVIGPFKDEKRFQKLLKL